MLPFLLGVIRAYAPYVVWPFAAVVGAIGYTIENAVRGDKQTPFRKSVLEEREERFLEEIEKSDPTEVESLKKHTFIPKTIFDRKT